MEDTIRLDRKSFEALAAHSRVKILKSLSARRKTLSELAKELGLSVSTMKEHLDVLAAAGLIIQMDEGRKWKYYELTRKGKGIVVPGELKVLIMLGISLLLVLGSGWNFLNVYSPAGMGTPDGSGMPGQGAAPEMEADLFLVGGEGAGNGMEAPEAHMEDGELEGEELVDNSAGEDAGAAYAKAEEDAQPAGLEAGGEAAPALSGAGEGFPYAEAAFFGASVLLLVALAAYSWKSMRHL